MCNIRDGRRSKCLSAEGEAVQAVQVVQCQIGDMNPDQCYTQQAGMWLIILSVFITHNFTIYIHLDRVHDELSFKL